MEREKSTISVILPTLNEPAVGEIIRRIRKSLSDHNLKEIIVVDRSTDETPNIARKEGAKIVFQKGIGYGDAYLQGFKEVTGDIIVIMDPDGTYLPEEIPLLLEPIYNEEADIVIGNRWANMKKNAMTPLNKFGNKFLTFLLNKLYSLDIKDSQSGMRAIRKDKLDLLDLYHPGMALASEMIIEATKKHLRICEVPITYDIREGQTKQNVLNGFVIAGETIRLLRDFSPLTLFGSIAFISLLLSVIFSISPIYNYLKYGTLTTPGRAILAAMFFNSAVVLAMFALMLDLLVKEIKAAR